MVAMGGSDARLRRTAPGQAAAWPFPSKRSRPTVGGGCCTRARPPTRLRSGFRWGDKGRNNSSPATTCSRRAAAGLHLSPALPSLRYNQLPEGDDRAAVCCVAARSTTKRRTSARPNVTGTCRRTTSTMWAFIRRVPGLAGIRGTFPVERARVQNSGRRPVFRQRLRTRRDSHDLYKGLIEGTDYST